jgi:hypothetical protein
MIGDEMLRTSTPEPLMCYHLGLHFAPPQLAEIHSQAKCRCTDRTR